jgi:pentose-5-phosphate-3-epimerase
VQNLTIGPCVVTWLRKHLPTTHFDCHMVVTNPRNYIDLMSKAGANCFTFHYESEHGDLKEICELIHKGNMEVGIALNPKTPLDATID